MDQRSKQAGPDPDYNNSLNIQLELLRDSKTNGDTLLSVSLHRSWSGETFLWSAVGLKLCRRG